MSGTIFDLVDEDLPEGQEGFMEFASRAPEVKDDSFFETVKDYGKTILKGGAEGLLKLGLALSPSRGVPMRPVVTPPEAEKMQAGATELLNELLPTDEGYVQSSLRRGLREAPTALAFPGGSAVRPIIAGFLGEGAKELGLPEWAETAAELTAYLGPDMTKKLLTTGKNKDIIKAAKELGLSDEALTPLLQSEFKQKWLTKLSPKRGATQRALQRSQSELGKAATELEKRGVGLSGLSEESSLKFITEIDEKLHKMPAAVRSKIVKDYEDLTKAGKYTAEDLINFYRDVNHTLGPRSKQLSLIKEPIKKAIGEIDPALAKDFDLINNLYSKYYNISKKLKPTLTSDIITGAEALAATISVSTGNYVYLSHLASEKAARKLAQQMLINPRFQQLGSKMVESLNNNKPAIALKVAKLLEKEVRKTSPEIADKLLGLSEDELEDFLSHH